MVEKCKGIQKSIGNFFANKEAKKKPLTFNKVFESEKEAVILKLLQEASNEEAKYIVRWL